MQSRTAIVAFVLVAVGVVWIGQGVGLLRGQSFMVDDIRWAVIGAVLVTAGAAVGARAWVKRG